MIQDYYQKAMKFAAEKHFNQTIPDSKSNYLLHLSNVAMEVLIAYQNKNNFDLKLAIQSAILHDTIEDTKTTFDEIKENFGLQVANIVLALTKDKSLSTKQQQMKDSLQRINSINKEAGIVKLADRITNLQEPPKKWNKDKIVKYQVEAKLILDALKNKNEYLANRLQIKIEEYSKYFEENRRKYFLKSKRLGFSTWHKDDIEFAYSLWGDYEVTKFIGGKFSSNQIEIKLQNEIKNLEDFGVQYWPIFLLENNEFVGCCGLRPYDISKGIFEIGFHLKKIFWNQKLGFESANTIIEYSCNASNIKILFAGHNPQNIGSKKLLEKLGFNYTHDEFYEPTKLMHPSYELILNNFKL